MKNIDLATKYNKIYKEGAYSNYFTFNFFPGEKLIIDAIPNWGGLNVLDIGCGQGSLVAMLSFAGAKKVDGVDFSSEAIKKAKERIRIENTNFICSDFKEIKENITLSL